ncbi:MAG: hypothetical protein SGCHY_001862 [Lobulomycetales sp.]
MAEEVPASPVDQEPQTASRPSSAAAPVDATAADANGSEEAAEPGSSAAASRPQTSDAAPAASIAQKPNSASAHAPPADEPRGPPAIIYENTYKTKPDVKFSSQAVKRLVDQLLEDRLKGVQYDPVATPELAKTIANEILQDIKKLGIERYKYVVDVTLGEYKGQGVRIASRCVWDTSTDSYASSSFRNQ